MIAGELGYVGKETDRKWEEGDEISILEFTATEYGRKGKVIASEEVKTAIQRIGINFVRKLVRGIPVKRNSYNEFLRWLKRYKLQNQIQTAETQMSEARG